VHVFYITPFKSRNIALRNLRSVSKLVLGHLRSFPQFEDTFANMYPDFHCITSFLLRRI